MLARGERATFRLGEALELAALAVVLGISFAGMIAVLVLFRPFSIPAESGAPTIVVGDYVVVSRYAYGFSRYSLPFGDILPLGLTGVLSSGEPKRGDVAVFKLPKDNAADYIKRVVGLPGDRVQIVAGTLTINGQPVKRQRVADYETFDILDQPVKVTQYEETLPGGATYRVIEREGDRGFWDNTDLYTVPPKHFFTMGDNRDNSTDSRDLASVGYIPIQNLVGRADLVLFSVSKVPGRDGLATTSLPWSRFLMTIR
jgi:signal peptidase I